MPNTEDDFSPDDANGRAYRDALGKFATGVTIVTCNSDVGPLGMTANSFASVSLDPPLVLWSPARASKRCAAFEAAKRFAVHVLNDTQKSDCQIFAKEGHNFQSLDWSLSDDGVPLIEGCLARFQCVQHAIHDGGDHVIIVGRVIAAAVQDGNPLVFSRGAFGRFEKMA
ncbi:flavin reductase family protein [Rhodobacteraceae bacterium]|nr:flavin reductase family protein [Paracoccaceae bacterium]